MTARTPRVSVIIPTFNRRDYLAEAIASVLAQTFTDYEIVVVDDGSTDGTRELIEERYPRSTIVYQYQLNRGSSAARNAGMRAARGELLAFLDSDDLWLPRKLELQVPLFDRNRIVGFVFCGSAGITKSGGYREVREPTEEYRGRALRAMLYRNMMPTPTVVFRKHLVTEVGYMYEDLSFGEDWNYWLRIAARCEVDFVPEILVHYRAAPGGLSGIDFDSYRRNTVGLYEGLFREPATAALFEPYRMEALSHAHTLVAGEALAVDRLGVARHEAWQAIRLRAGNAAAWRILVRALLGTRLLLKLRRWRRKPPRSTETVD
ncbi:MAG TPA: glycosyltransferase [Candidatus Dormibacteraeota bacterium]|nr:glycosyltransferase [Candidatus Dormibacteraeota bacterium]